MTISAFTLSIYIHGTYVVIARNAYTTIMLMQVSWNSMYVTKYDYADAGFLTKYDYADAGFLNLYVRLYHMTSSSSENKH